MSLPRVRINNNGRVHMRDSLQNLLTGMGTYREKMTHTRFGFGVVDRGQLEAAYRNDWIARKVVDIPAKDATREWRNWQADQNDITNIEALEKAFNIQRKVKQALQKARLYGGAALILGVNNQNMEDELIVDTVKKGSLQFVHCVSRHEINAGPLDLNILSPYYGEPQYYDRTTGEILRIHPSRVVRLLGPEVPNIEDSNNGWGDSILQTVNDAIKSAGTVAQSVAQLVQEAQVDIIKIDDLNDTLSDPVAEQRLMQRFAMSADAKSLYRMMLLDGGEEWQRQTANFTALPDVLKMYLLIASGASDIPATRMLSQSPTGLSATGESDIRNYYDNVASEQKNELTPALNRLDQVLVRSALGAYPPDLFYQWNSLWQLDDVQKADLAAKKAATFQIDANAGLLDQQVLKRARENQLIEDGTYPGLENIIEEEETFGGEDETELLLKLPEDPEEAEFTADALRTIRKSARKRERIRLDRKRNRVRLISDAKVATLYVRRDVLNAAEIIAHFKKQGFEKALKPADMHVTIIYSRDPVDWSKIPEPWGEDDRKTGNLTIQPGGMRAMQAFGPQRDIAVMSFTSSVLNYRNMMAREYGCSWDWENYEPHITISKNGPRGFEEFEPWRGKIELGPEIWEEVRENAMATMIEDAKRSK